MALESESVVVNKPLHGRKWEFSVSFTNFPNVATLWESNTSFQRSTVEVAKNFIQWPGTCVRKEHQYLIKCENKKRFVKRG